MQATITANGIQMPVSYRNEDVKAIFTPLLKHWTWLWRQREDGRRVVVFMSAPPGAGKTTLALFLEQLSSELDDCEPLQALGMDGFHYPNATLDEKGLRSWKGAPDTFDAAALMNALADLDSARPHPWPAYSRQLHEPVADAVPIERNIVLVEGSYFQLDEEPWASMRMLADETVFISARAGILRGRLVNRRTQGGMDGAEAVAAYKGIDRPNIDFVLRHSVPAMVNLQLDVVGGEARYQLK